MRDLTAEELALTPEWATHYYAYNDGYILFECNVKYQYYDAKKKEFHDPIGCLNVSEDSALIVRKPFDITQHEFSDDFTYFDFDLHKDRGAVIIDGEVNRDDIIAMAKYLKVKPEDLK